MAKLTPKQQRFCEEYMIDLNATQAAIRAGYSEKTAKQQGSRLLTNVDILARVRELRSEQVKRLGISADWVILNIEDIYSKCMQAKPIMEWDHAEKKMKETGEYIFDSKGALRSMELIGKHLGMFDTVKNNPSEEDKSTGVVILPEVKIEPEDKGGGDDG